MRRLWPFIVATLFAFAGAARARAQDAPLRVTDRGVIIDFQDADLRLVITALAEAGHLNVVYGDLPQRRVTLRMAQPLPPEEVLPLLKSLATSNRLSVTEEKDYLRIDAQDPAGASPAADSSQAEPEVRLVVYRLKHARASQLASTLGSVFGGSRASREPGSQPVPLSQGLRESHLPPAQPDSQGSGPAVSVDLATARRGIPGQLRGEVQIVPDERTNSLVVRAQPDDWEVIRQAIEQLDLRPLQVLIEVVIAEVRRTKELELSASGIVADSKTDPAVRGTLRGTTTGDVVLQVLRAGKLDLSAALSLLSSRGEVKILSRPVVLAQNNQEARILVGSERPFIQASRSLPTDAGVRDEVIQYRDVGTKLTITPTINQDGYVDLQVLQEVSTATAELQFGAPVISTREASTHLFLKDGQTAVLGGLIDRQQERVKSGVPILMDVPLVGGLFGSRHNTTTNSELFLFLTPHVVATDEDMDRTRDDIRGEAKLLQDLVPAPKQ